MNVKHISYSDTKLFRSIVRNVRDGAKYHNVSEPILIFEGTIKLHGTNMGITQHVDGNLHTLSRSRVCSVADDIDNRAMFLHKHMDYFKPIMDRLKRDGYITTLFGELIGKGIQSGCSIHNLEKSFVAFSVKYTSIVDETDCIYIKIPDWIGGDVNSDNNIYNIRKFKTYTVTIDFAHPEIARNEIVKLVEDVEEECPFGKAFGFTGIGEGIVFSNYDDNGVRVHTFKAKGEKHSKSKVKKIVAIDIEKVNSIEEFVDYAVTEGRLRQGIDEVFEGVPATIERTGDFVRWIHTDVFKEELDTMVENGLTVKETSGTISRKARN